MNKQSIKRDFDLKRKPGQRGVARKPAVYKHALSQIWKAMIVRCYTPSSKSYMRYGGRGIFIFEEWKKSFWEFAEYVENIIGPRPSSKHSLDRINANGNYVPGNLRWATQTEQLRNMCRNRFVTFDGNVLCLAEWAQVSGVSAYVLRSRLFQLGWSVEKALTTPVRKISSFKKEVL